MLKKYHVSKNLFDKDDSSLQYSGTNLAASNVWRTSGSGLVFRIPCQSLTTYTISCDVDTTVWRLSYVESDEIPSSSTSVTTIDVVRNKPTNGVYTFTTTANTKYILFQIGTNSLDEALDVLMLNTGSTAEPYEPYGNTWTEIPYRKYATETDTLTTLPEDIIADGNNAEVLIKGNMQQTGTPSPSSIIMPEETGERTINLFNKNDVEDIRVEYNGVESASNYYILSTFIPVNNGVTVSATKLLTDPIRIIRYDANKQFISRTDENTADNIVVDDCAYIRINANKDHWDINTIQAEYGRTATAFEPYGFKLPVESGGVTTPIYLDEPLRKIGEYADEVGETGNLCDISDFTETITAFNYKNHLLIENLPIGTYTLSYIIHRTISDPFYIMIGIGENNFTQNVASKSNQVDGKVEITFTIEEQTNVYVRYERYLTAQTVTAEISNVMLNEGSTALPYQPYGYAVTRYIKKLVLTGQEEWYKPATTTNAYRITLDGYMREMVNVPVCTHYSGIAPVDGTARLNNLDTAFLLSSSGNNYFYIRDDDYTSAADFKAYLAAQYTAGTPVTVWYVLTTPTTETITMPTIPTTAGSQTFDVNTSLKPSEVQLTYKGWHKHSPKVYNNGSWA